MLSLIVVKYSSKKQLVGGNLCHTSFARGRGRPQNKGPRGVASTSFISVCAYPRLVLIKISTHAIKRSSLIKMFTRATLAQSSAVDCIRTWRHHGLSRVPVYTPAFTLFVIFYVSMVALKYCAQLPMYTFHRRNAV